MSWNTAKHTSSSTTPSWFFSLKPRSSPLAPWTSTWLRRSSSGAPVCAGRRLRAPRPARSRSRTGTWRTRGAGTPVARRTWSRPRRPARTPPRTPPGTQERAGAPLRRHPARGEGQPSTHSGWSASCWRTRGSSPEGGVYDRHVPAEARAARSTLATVAAGPTPAGRWPRPAGPAAPAAPGPPPGGTAILAATASGLAPTPTASAFPPCRRSRCRRSSARSSAPWGAGTRRSRNAIPWSVGAMRNTFGRVSGSTRPSPPWYTMQIGTFAARSRPARRVEPGALVHDGDALSATALRTLSAAFDADRPVSYRLAGTCSSPIRTPPRRRRSGRPRAGRPGRWSAPRTASTENGAFIAIRSRSGSPRAPCRRTSTRKRRGRLPPAPRRGRAERGIHAGPRTGTV